VTHNALKLEVDTQLAFTKDKELGWMASASKRHVGTRYKVDSPPQCRSKVSLKVLSPELSKYHYILFRYPIIVLPHKYKDKTVNRKHGQNNAN